MTDSTKRQPLRILISGAGIAGPILVYWLAKAGAQVTVVERATKLRTEGQTVDVRVEGVEVLRRMGLEQAVKLHATREKGLCFLDRHTGQVKASFPEQGSDSFTGEIEIVRGVLAKFLFEQVQKQATWLFAKRSSILTKTKGARV